VLDHCPELFDWLCQETKFRRSQPKRGHAFPSAISGEAISKILVARKSLTSTSNLISETREMSGSFKKNRMFSPLASGNCLW